MALIADNLNNMFGRLKADILTRLSEVAQDPNAYWDRDHGIILRADKGWLTLWQAVRIVDPTFDGYKIGSWSRKPDQVTIGRALRYAASL